VNPRLLFFVCSLVVALAPLAAQSEAVDLVSEIDWHEATVTTKATVDLRSFDGPLPSIRAQALDLVAKALPVHLLDAFGGVAVNSSTNVAELAARSPRILAGLRSIAGARRPSRNHVSPDLATLTLEFVYTLYPDLTELFVTHTRAYEHRRYLGFYPSTEFSGIVIYARGSFPVHGENGTNAAVVPALMPRIFDESMNLVFETGMVEPDLAVANGVVAYTSSADLFEARSRVGDAPLVTMARAVPGNNRTDLVIPDAAARRILSLTANRELLAEGKVLIICDL